MHQAQRSPPGAQPRASAAITVSGPASGDATVSLVGEVTGMRVPRDAVARVLADAADPDHTRYRHRTVSVSAAAA